MKKQIVTSLLTVTAAMASQVVLPTNAMARPSLAERAFPADFLLKGNVRVRYKVPDSNKTVEGRIILSLQQTDVVQPGFPNGVKGEMQGMLYFEAMEEVTAIGSRGPYTYTPMMALAGDDGEVLLDLIHRGSDSEHVYSVFGCNSTRTACDVQKYTVTFQKNAVYLNLNDAEVEGLEFYNEREAKWEAFASNMAMTLSPNQD